MLKTTTETKKCDACGGNGYRPVKSGGGNRSYLRMCAKCGSFGFLVVDGERVRRVNPKD